MSDSQSSVSSSLHQIRRVREEIHGLLRHVRSEEPQAADPQARALLETAAEVLSGLVRACEGYEQRNNAGAAAANPAETATEKRQAARQASEWTDHLEGIPPGRPD